MGDHRALNAALQAVESVVAENIVADGAASEAPAAEVGSRVAVANEVAVEQRRPRTGRTGVHVVVAVDEEPGCAAVLHAVVGEVEAGEILGVEMEDIGSAGLTATVELVVVDGHVRPLPVEEDAGAGKAIDPIVQQLIPVVRPDRGLDGGTGYDSPAGDAREGEPINDGVMRASEIEQRSHGVADDRFARDAAARRHAGLCPTQRQGALSGGEKEVLLVVSPRRDGDRVAARGVGDRSPDAAIVGRTDGERASRNAAPVRVVDAAVRCVRGSGCDERNYGRKQRDL